MDSNLENYGFYLPTNFWLTYQHHNEDSELIILARLGAHYFNIPLNFMKLLAIVCKTTFDLVQWRIVKCHALRKKYLPKFREALHARIIGHPFKYTKCETKIFSILTMGYSNYGLRILDITDDTYFNDEKLATQRLALYDVSFIVSSKVSFVGIFFIGNNAVMSFEVDSKDLIESINPHGYLARLNLPIKINPITLESPFIMRERIHLCIAPNWSIHYIDDKQVVDVLFNNEFVVDNFTHAVVKFKTVSQTAYDWSKYGITFNGKINTHAQTTSFIRSLDDPKIEDPKNNYTHEIALQSLFSSLGIDSDDDMNSQ